jgi:predicted ATPase
LVPAPTFHPEVNVTIYRFGEFELDPGQRRLSKGEAAIRIGARAFDVLTCLLEKAGTVVTKEEIIRTVWPSTYVDEASLRVHMVALRKAIYDGEQTLCIESIPGLGYKFAKPVSTITDDSSASTAPTTRYGLPATVVRLIGRDEFIAHSVELMRSMRLMTITGPGGIGKTSAAIEIARSLATENKSVVFLDLAALSNGELIVSHLASSLGLSVFSSDPMPGIVQALGNSRTVLVFDNCEHLIDSCADVIDRLLQLTPSTSVIATSREPLRIASEKVRLLPSLEVPKKDDLPSACHDFSALELFNERLIFATGQNGLTEMKDISIAADIVRRLDGIPLAIELAASRVAGLGLQNTASSLSDPINTLWRGRRTAPPRQQTLRATIEWSYNLLTTEERLLLNCLSVFAGPFTGDAAWSIARDFLDRETFSDALSALRSKSLVSTSRGDGRLRLLEMTRAFARRQLNAGEFAEACGLSHARWVGAELEHAKAGWRNLDKFEWLQVHGDLINDIRAALDWCFDTGQRKLCFEITAASHILWTQLGLMNEQLKVVERAMALMETTANVDPLIETQLRSTLGLVLFHVRGLRADQKALREFEKAAEIAETIGDHVEIVRAHSGRCAIITTQGRYAEAAEIALQLESKFGKLAHGASSRILAMNTHFLGQHEKTHQLCTLAVEATRGPIGRTLTSGAGFDQKTVALMLMAKTSWIQGFSQRAIALADEAIAEALNLDDAISICLAIYVSAFPVYFGLGEFQVARHHLALLRELSTKHSMFRSQLWADAFELLLPESNATTRQFETAFVGDTNGSRLETVITLAGERCGADLVDWALAGDAGWCRPELLRIKGDIVRHSDPAMARDLYSQAFAGAITQKSPLWQLRAANSNAEWLQDDERSTSKRMIEAALKAFPEAPPRIELQTAERLLAL